MARSPGTVSAAHAQAPEAVLARLAATRQGLERSEARRRQAQYGPNRLPRARPPGMARIFLRQFASPLIYVLLAAALLSLLIGEFSDAGFIAAVLLVNALIGGFQEHAAQRAAVALGELVPVQCHVLRDGEAFEIPAEELVPGDLVLLEPGDRVPADIRLLAAHELQVDESALTGESLAVSKAADALLPADTYLGERRNMAFAGTLVVRGRARGVVTATGLATELGGIASAVLARGLTTSPLMVRMERFTRRVALVVGLAALLVAAIAFGRGMPLVEIFFLTVALAVSVIPEGLPVALTVALAIGMRRMARRNVIIRRLVAVEALGSCTFIATDKTGTLTVNQLTVSRLAHPDGGTCVLSGEGFDPEGGIDCDEGVPAASRWLTELCEAAVLPNEAFFGRRDGEWVQHGDAVDVALLVMAHKAGVVREVLLDSRPELASIPFESERMISASLNLVDGEPQAFVKGAAERVLAMCARTPTSAQPPDPAAIEALVEELAQQGCRVLALARGPVHLAEDEVFSEEHLQGLCFLGLVGMIDPLREEAAPAVARCRAAGIEVAMVTGDHPLTALAIARPLGLAEDLGQVVTGPELRRAANEEQLDRLTRNARVFARVEPTQKLDIVTSLQRQGHFVAVSGDGANDAPALRAAQVGVAMGRSGTDVARETADLIITDDNFSSIVAGVEEGRVAYANVRKVIFLLVSTGAAELVLFTLALLTGLPVPLLAVQLLWLNLVTNGIQDIALAFEPAEGDELRRPPRSPREPIFNRIMVERVLLSALVIGGVAFWLYQWLLAQGYSLEAARNGTLLLMVLFENIHVFNCRSERRSVFMHGFLGNRILLAGTVAAQLVHIGAMYTPGLREVLGVQPVSPMHWAQLLLAALSILVAMEIYKLLRSRLA